MEIADIIRRLQELQIEESNLLAELASRERNNEVPRSYPQPPNRRGSTPIGREQLTVGDEVLLLTRGAKCCKGDTATVTKVSPNTVHFTVHRTGHATYKKIENVKKITSDKRE